MAFMKDILDNGTPTGQSEANTSEEEGNHARLSLTRDNSKDTNDDTETENNDRNSEKDNRDNEDNSKSQNSSGEDEPSYSSFSESEDETENKHRKKERHKSDSQSSTHSNEERRKLKRKPPTGYRNQPWSNPEPQSHQDMLQAKFAELQSLLIDHNGSQVDKHLLKKTKAYMKQCHVAQAGLIPGSNIRGPKSPRGYDRNTRSSWTTQSTAWHEDSYSPEYMSPSPITATGDEYILIDGTGDEVKTRRVKFSNVETESIPDDHPSREVLGSLGLPFPVAPPGHRPTSGFDRSASGFSRISRPRRKAASAERPRVKREPKQRKSSTRTPSAESRSSSRSSSSRSRSRSESRSTKTDNDKAKKTDHRLKDTDNHTLQEWLKKKDKELKAKKKEVRKRKKEQREQKRREYEEKEKLKEKSEEAVKMWFVKKEEEQRLLQRRERVKRPLQKNDFSYSLELITFGKPDGDSEDHHASNPEISSREASGAPFVSSSKPKRAPKLRAKSAKAKPNMADKQEEDNRKSYDKWLEEKREAEEKAKETSQFERDSLDTCRGDENKESVEKTIEESVVENSEKFEEEFPKPDMDDEGLLTDVGKRRDVNMNIKRKDSDSFDPYDTPKDYTLDNETRRNLMQYSDSLEKQEDSPTKLESSSPSFRMPSPPLLSQSPVPMRDKPPEFSANGDLNGGPNAGEMVPHPPRPDVPRSSAYRRVKREQASWDELADNVWTPVNEEAAEQASKEESPVNDENSDPKDDSTVDREDGETGGIGKTEAGDQDSDEMPDLVKDEDGPVEDEVQAHNYDIQETTNQKGNEEGPEPVDSQKYPEKEEIEATQEETACSEDMEDEKSESDGNQENNDAVDSQTATVGHVDDASEAVTNDAEEAVDEAKKKDETAHLEATSESNATTEYDGSYGEALHLNPIREETEPELETNDSDKLANPERTNSSEKLDEPKADTTNGTTFLTTGEE